MSKIESLNPQIVWKHFAAICNIPHPSKHEEKIREYIVNFAKKNSIACVVDATGNVILSKPATAGFENRKGIIMQAHIDMVPQKNNDTKFDFLTDPIRPYIDGEWVTADGTTLGSDNGIGAAAALAIMELNDIPHGPIEALFTVDEETGMTGAFNLAPKVLKGDILINLDSEDEGKLYIGCAGGTDVMVKIGYKTVPMCACKKVLNVYVSGLKGGHSGMEVILQRANSNKLMVRILHQLLNKFGIEVVKAEGGNMRNAIPREANFTIAVEASKVDAVLAEIKSHTAVMKEEFAETDPDISVTVTEGTATEVICADSLRRFINVAHAMPNGIDRTSTVMEGLVETSSNMGIIKMADGMFSIMILARSSSKSTMDDLTARIRAVGDLAGVVTEINNGYDGWKPNLQSPILKTMIARYKALYGKEPEIKAVHAGLECGIFGPIYPNWDMISFGPTIRFPHSPDEKVQIESVEKFFNLLLETIKDAPKK